MFLLTVVVWFTKVKFVNIKISLLNLEIGREIFYYYYLQIYSLRKLKFDWYVEELSDFNLDFDNISFDLK